MLSALLHPIDLAIDAYLVGMPTNDDDDDDLKGTSAPHVVYILTTALSISLDELQHSGGSHGLNCRDFTY